MFGFLHDGRNPAVGVKFNHTVAFRVPHEITENQSPMGHLDGTLQGFGEARAIEDIIS